MCEYCVKNWIFVNGVVVKYWLCVLTKYGKMLRLFPHAICYLTLLLSFILSFSTVFVSSLSHFVSSL
jgi:hypothetical protein